MRGIEMRLLPAFLLFVALTLSACGGDDEPTKAPPPTPAAAVAVEDAATNEDSELESEDATREAEEAEATEAPTEAPPSPTPAPSLTAGPSPTAQPSVTPGPLPAGLPETDPEAWPASHLSPDGRWWVRSAVGAEIPVANGRALDESDADSVQDIWYHRGQQVISTDGAIVHEVIDEWSPFGMGFPSPAVLGWTPDSRWVYLFETGVADGCGIYAWGKDLRRLDPESGEIQYLSGDLTSKPALSADGSTVAFISRDNLVLLRPNDGSFLEAAIPGHEDPSMQAGDPSFATDGAVEFVVDYGPCSDAWTRAKVRFDPANGRIELMGTPAPRE